jgi:hypothetical protein
MSVPAPRPPRNDGRWETIRYALDSWARTFRLCLICLVLIAAPAAAAHPLAELIRPILLCGPVRDLGQASPYDPARAASGLRRGGRATRRLASGLAAHHRRGVRVPHNENDRQEGLDRRLVLLRRAAPRGLAHHPHPGPVQLLRSAHLSRADAGDRAGRDLGRRPPRRQEHPEQFYQHVWAKVVQQRRLAHARLTFDGGVDGQRVGQRADADAALVQVVNEVEDLAEVTADPVMSVDHDRVAHRQ